MKSARPMSAWRQPGIRRAQDASTVFTNPADMTRVAGGQHTLGAMLRSRKAVILVGSDHHRRRRKVFASFLAGPLDLLTRCSKAESRPL